MLKGSNIFGKIEFGLAVSGLIPHVIWLVFVLQARVIADDQEARIGSGTFLLIATAALNPYFILCFLTYHHAKGSMHAGFFAAGISMLMIPAYIFIFFASFGGGNLVGFLTLVYLILLPIAIIVAFITNEYFLSAKRFVRRRDHDSV